MLKKFIKSVTSSAMRTYLRNTQKTVVYSWRRYVLSIAVFLNRPVNIILGAALTNQGGWYSTNEQWLDITCIDDWNAVFKKKILIRHAVAEHVFEHLTVEECRRTLSFIYDHLQVSGTLRIAVPDGNHPDPIYIQNVGVNGIGADAEDHKQLLTFEKLSEMLNQAGFTVEHLEGYTAKGELVQRKADFIGGNIFRSRSNLLSSCLEDDWSFPDANTSLIVDGYKK
jgi:predicted SAM-dependent methyltransferase